MTADERVDIDVRVSSPDYFTSMGMNLLDGRDLQRTDRADAMQVAVISASLGRKLWPGERAVGKRIDVLGRVHGQPNWVTVVGVVSDVHDLALNAPARPTVYVPFTQMLTGFWENALRRSLVLVVQTKPEPETLLRAVRQAVMSVDPSLPLADDHTPEDDNHVDRALGSFALNGPVISPVKQPCQKKAIMAASSFTKRIT